MRLQRVASMSAAKGIEGSRPILARQRKFPVPEIRELAVRPPKSDPIMEVALPEPADSDVFPCTFPADQGIEPERRVRSRLPPPPFSLRFRRFRSRSANHPQNPGIIGERLGDPEPETVGCRRRSHHSGALSPQPDVAVRDGAGLGVCAAEGHRSHGRPCFLPRARGPDRKCMHP